MPRAIRDESHIVILSKVDTGQAKRVSASDCEVFRDTTRAFEQCHRDDLRALPTNWRRHDRGYLYITRAWTDLYRRRKIAVYAFQVRTDGSLGRRERLQFRVNGKPRQGFW